MRFPQPCRPLVPGRSSGQAWITTMGLGAVLLAGQLALPAHAHHLVEINGLQATPLNGLISGLFHPVLGPDHLLFLLALSLVGLRHRRRWMLGLLAVGLLGSGLGLVAPGLRGAELIAATTIALEGLVLLGRLPVAVLLPAMAIHGYVLSGPVLGWSAMPIAFYGLGLLASQGALLLVALAGLRSLVQRLSPTRLRWMALGLIGASAVLAYTSLRA